MTWSFAGAIVGVAGIIAGAIVSLIKSGRQHDIRPECQEARNDAKAEASEVWNRVSRIESRLSALEASNAALIKTTDRIETKIDGVLVALARRQEE